MSRIADPTAKFTLLRAAEEVFAERGMAGAKVEDISKRAGLSKGAFYLHFESKEAALKEVVEGFLERCNAHFAPPSAYPTLPEDAEALLEFCLERDVQIYEFLWQNRAILRILSSCQGAFDYLVLAFRDRIARTSREWVDHWRREGLFRDDTDPILATVLIGGGYNELTLVMLQASAERPPLEAWLAFAQQAYMRAFGTAELQEALDRRNRRLRLTIESTDASGQPGWFSSRGRVG